MSSFSAATHNTGQTGESRGTKITKITKSSKNTKGRVEECYAIAWKVTLSVKFQGFSHQQTNMFNGCLGLFFKV